jgi:histidine triad (HIT) family protein
MAIDILELEPCPFCAYLAGAERCAFVSRGPAVSSFLNRTQYERGAVLVVPNQHVTSMVAAEPALVGQVYREVHRVASALVVALQPAGLSVFQNNGVLSGQTVPHFHVHVVPRFPGSDPRRRFQEAEFAHTPPEVLESLAGRIRKALPTEPESGDPR